ncbi:MAG: zinc ABC transporter substrate-binding protein [Paracoccus sp. (in: a-proteobacteria)]
MRLPTMLALTLIAPPVMAAPPQIITDMPVTASLVQQVLGDLGEVSVILDQGANPHDFQLRPSQARSLQDAGLLVWMGPELTPWLSLAAAARDSKAEIRLLHQPDTMLRNFPNNEGEDNHEHSDHDHEHSHEGVDPHAWLDPDNAALWLGLIAEHLAGIDPENAATYAANSTAAQTGLMAQDQALTELLSPLADQPFVIFHDAYGYFTDHYGLQPAIAISSGDATPPSAARLRELQTRVTNSGVRCIFPEANQPRQPIDRLVEGSMIEIGGPLSPTGSNISLGSGYYMALLNQTGQRIAACLTSKINN